MARLTKTIALTLAGIALAVVAAPSCDEGSGVSDADCDIVVRRCATYCDSYSAGCYSSYWGCCYDRCWYDCAGRSKREPVSQPSSSPAPDAASDAAPAP